MSRKICCGSELRKKKMIKLNDWCPRTFTVVALAECIFARREKRDNNNREAEDRRISDGKSSFDFHESAIQRTEGDQRPEKWKHISRGIEWDTRAKLEMIFFAMLIMTLKNSLEKGQKHIFLVKEIFKLEQYIDRCTFLLQQIRMMF